MIGSNETHRSEDIRAPKTGTNNSSLHPSATSPGFPTMRSTPLTNNQPNRVFSSPALLPPTNPSRPLPQIPPKASNNSPSFYSHIHPAPPSPPTTIFISGNKGQTKNQNKL